MKIISVEMVDHLKSGGRVKKSGIGFAYVKLDMGELGWFDSKTHKFIACVEAFSDLVSNDWEIVNEDTLRGSGGSKALRLTGFTNGSLGGFRVDPDTGGGSSGGEGA